MEGDESNCSNYEGEDGQGVSTLASSNGNGNGEEAGDVGTLPGSIQPQRSIIQKAPPGPAARQIVIDNDKKNKAKGKEKRRLNCAVENCLYSTTYSKDLARHMRKHTGEKPFSCKICPKSFTRYDKLVLHVRSHQGYRPYKCTLCEYAAVESGSLTKHMRKHTGVRPYKCQLCPYAAKDSSQLLIHLRSHTGDSPYFCTAESCKSAFKSPSDLQRHLRLHTGAKPYSCPYCSHKTSTKSNLNVHVRKHKRNSVKEASCLKDSLSLSPSSGQSPVSVILDDADELITSPPPYYSKVPCTQPESSPCGSLYYVCKVCFHKSESYELFLSHERENHESLPEKKVSEASRAKVAKGGKRGKKPQESLEISRVEKLHKCSICSVSFVREDSLRCHIKQHTDPVPSSVIRINPNSGSSKSMQKNNYANRDQAEECGGSGHSLLGSQVHEHIGCSVREPNSYNVTSVITENPAAINPTPNPSSTATHYVYVLSPGGSIVQSMERQELIS